VVALFMAPITIKSGRWTTILMTTRLETYFSLSFARPTHERPTRRNRTIRTSIFRNLHSLTIRIVRVQLSERTTAFPTPRRHTGQGQLRARNERVHRRGRERGKGGCSGAGRSAVIRPRVSPRVLLTSTSASRPHRRRQQPKSRSRQRPGRRSRLSSSGSSQGEK
jgi:hypothetical protein